MSEPWKVTICSNEACLRGTLDDNGKVKEDYHLYPDVDNEKRTQFTCPRCGAIESWGPTRRQIAKALYERLN